jgi:perosamine synthetase
MHTFGFPVDIDPLMKVCGDWNLPIIEDAAESLGSLYRGKHTGVFGLMGTLSFNGNKIVTTGGGGAILTADKALAEKAKHLSTTAKKPHPWEFEHDEIGYNYRMPNLNAALGCAQLEQLDSFLESKRQLAERVADAVSSVAGVTFQREPEYSRSNYWLITLRLDVSSLADRNKTLEDLHGAGILARPAWRLLSELPMYAACPKASLENAVELERVLLNVPSSAFIGTR